MCRRLSMFDPLRDLSQLSIESTEGIGASRLGDAAGTVTQSKHDQT